MCRKRKASAGDGRFVETVSTEVCEDICKEGDYLRELWFEWESNCPQGVRLFIAE